MKHKPVYQGSFLVFVNIFRSGKPRLLFCCLLPLYDGRLNALVVGKCTWRCRVQCSLGCAGAVLCTPCEKNAHAELRPGNKAKREIEWVHTNNNSIVRRYECSLQQHLPEAWDRAHFGQAIITSRLH